MRDCPAMARRNITLTIDVGLGAAVDANFTRELTEADVRLTRGDVLALQFICQRSPDNGQNWQAFPFSAGTAFRFGLKSPSAVTGADFLAYADGTAWNNTADWADALPSSGRLCVLVNTATAALATFLNSAGTDAVKAIAEIEANEPGGEPFTVARFWVNCYNDVIRGTEGTPAPSSPTYATLAQLNAVICPGFTVTRSGNEISFNIDGVPVETIQVT